MPGLHTKLRFAPARVNVEKRGDGSMLLTSPLDLGTRWELFVDEFLVAEKSGLTLKLAGITTLILLVLSTPLAWWLAGEVPAQNVLMGGALVLGALVVNSWLDLRQSLALRQEALSRSNKRLTCSGLGKGSTAPKP